MHKVHPDRSLVSKISRPVKFISNLPHDDAVFKTLLRNNDRKIVNNRKGKTGQINQHA